MSKILIVDDEPHIRYLLELTLEELEDDGAELLFAENGAIALEIIRAEQPQLVLLDVMMPEMDGFTVCDTVKNELAMKDIYIVLLTAKGQELDRNKGEAAGADLYMTKPFNPDDVLELARKILNI
ncbi:MAG: response regulator [Trichlorobacter sp.]|jgi:CheY-like chemotaxis protein|nr:response regulator [Trichlorobacter sp.]